MRCLSQKLFWALWRNQSMMMPKKKISTLLNAWMWGLSVTHSLQALKLLSPWLNWTLKSNLVSHLVVLVNLYTKLCRSTILRRHQFITKCSRIPLVPSKPIPQMVSSSEILSVWSASSSSQLHPEISILWLSSYSITILQMSRNWI